MQRASIQMCLSPSCVVTHNASCIVFEYLLAGVLIMNCSSLPEMSFWDCSPPQQYERAANPEEHRSCQSSELKDAVSITRTICCSTFVISSSRDGRSSATDSSGAGCRSVESCPTQ